jgi:hypothetical protein
MTQEQFVFKKTDRIGAAAAENDEYLNDCFVDTGITDILKSPDDSRAVLIGRTGAGKSAIISQLTKDCENVILINPHDLALAYISNSNVIEFFTELGINLSPFFKFLWKHVFVVEILKRHFNIQTKADCDGFMTNILNRYRGKQQETAWNYLKSWGDSFWQQTDFRVKEVTNTLEKKFNLTAEGSPIKDIRLNAEAAKTLSQEQKQEVITIGQKVVSGDQIRNLEAIMRILNDLLSQNRQKTYHIVIDRLDEDWIDSPLRLRLIRALIENGRDFFNSDNIKVIIALRTDLVQRVYKVTRDAGFQEEKYKSFHMNLSWSKRDMIELLDKRINAMVKRRYTTQDVSHADVLMRDLDDPEEISGDYMLDYMIHRTLYRPRDLISFFNTCIAQSDGNATINFATIQNAEEGYSRERLKALCDEWRGTYPQLNAISQKLLRSRPTQFEQSSISQGELESLSYDIVSKFSGGDQPDDYIIACEYNEANVDAIRVKYVYVLYISGLVGLLRNPESVPSYGFNCDDPLAEEDISSYPWIVIHPAFRKHLSVSAESC